MSAAAASLAAFNLRRILRGRLLLAAIVALPLIAGTVAALATASGPGRALDWLAPALAAAAAASLVMVQRKLDESSGLAETIAATKAGRSARSAACAASAVVLFAMQMVLFHLPRILR